MFGLMIFSFFMYVSSELVLSETIIGFHEYIFTITGFDFLSVVHRTERSISSIVDGKDISLSFLQLRKAPCCKDSGSCRNVSYVALIEFREGKKTEEKIRTWKTVRNFAFIFLILYSLKESYQWKILSITIKFLRWFLTLKYYVPIIVS